MISTTGEKINNFYVLVYNSILDNAIGRKPNYLAVFLYILLKANKKNSEFIFNNQKMIVKRGQWLGSIRQISEHFNLSTGTVSNILKYLKTESIIENKTTNRFTLFTVLNYDMYQPQLENKVENQLKTNKKQNETIDNIYKANEVNNKEKENNIKEKESFKKSTDEIISFFNQVHGTRFKTAGNEKNIKHWLSIYTPEEIKQAIDLIQAHPFWKGKMTPTILFRRKNPSGQDVDYIGQLLNQPRPRQSENEPFSQFEKRLKVWLKYDKSTK